MSGSPGDKIEWVPTDRFVMPLIPETLDVDPRTLALLHCMAFLELSGDDTVDPAWAVEAMEDVAHYLQRLDPEEVSRLRTEMRAVAQYAASQQMPPHFVELAARFTEYAGLEDND